ncbi:hypothetical protein AB1M95_16485 [Sulfitobacter sp. LCG007]
MHTDLQTRRRVLVTSYRRYLDADRAWSAAQADLKSWFPDLSLAHLASIGEPGSPVRRLYDERNRAQQRFETARLKLAAAKSRLARREAMAVALLADEPLN